MTATEPRYLIDTYLDFIHAEGLPIVESFGVDLLGIETQRRDICVQVERDS